MNHFTTSVIITCRVRVITNNTEHETPTPGHNDNHHLAHLSSKLICIADPHCLLSDTSLQAKGSQSKTYRILSRFGHFIQSRIRTPQGGIFSARHTNHVRGITAREAGGISNGSKFVQRIVGLTAAQVDFLHCDCVINIWLS